MQTSPANFSIKELLDLKSASMLMVNAEYQRGAVWTQTQKKKLIDSVLRGYPIPLIYLHHIEQKAGDLISSRYEIIDGQQRINALSDFADGGFKLLDPIKDDNEARFPEFIKQQPCEWAGKDFDGLGQILQDKFLSTNLQVVKINVGNSNEARDLFVRLQAGMPLNSQEKRDAWPGQFTEFVLKLGGKANVAKYQGHDFFNVLMKARRSQDRGKFRQLAAQLAMLVLNRQRTGAFVDTNSTSIDNFYYQNLGFDAQSVEAQHFVAALDKAMKLFVGFSGPKIIGHEAIHIILLIDSLLDDYTPSWEATFVKAFEQFRLKFAEAKRTRHDVQPNEYWQSYGVWTRVNSDQRDSIRKRHEFFATKMREQLNLQTKDQQRLFGALEREIIYYRQGKTCAVCDTDVEWSDADIHHVTQHRKGGKTGLENGALVHRKCHPKGDAAEEAFEKKWVARNGTSAQQPTQEELRQAEELTEDDAEI